MAWTRRGFLGTALAAIGAAVFDPIGKLWTRGPARYDGFPDTPREVLGLRGDAALEFDDLTQRIAKRLGERLAAGPALILGQVDFDTTGLRPGLIRLPDTSQVGRFEPCETRILSVADPHWSRRDIPDKLTAQLLTTEALGGLDVYAPIAGELRPGEPFDKDTAVALGTCPQTGLTVRVLQFHDDRTMRLGLEVAAGAWYSKMPAPSRAGWRV